jgi:hypothetical protein
MKPFDLEAALAGAKVKTGLGKPATDIAYLPSVDSPYKVVAVVDGGIRYFAENGRISKYNTNHFLDLFMAPDISEGWLNIYKERKIGYCLNNTEEEARASAAPDLITCIHIEWEE